MRLPSGYGSVYKLSGKRRKPWIARKTTGWTDEGRQTYLTIGYFATKNEALSALSAYNADPFDLDGSRLTFAEVYDKWKADTFTLETNKSTIKNYELAYKFCRSIYEKQITELKLPHLQQVVNECHSANQASRIKLLMKKMYEIFYSSYSFLISLFMVSMTIQIPATPNTAINIYNGILSSAGVEEISAKIVYP